jgi:hypothetical protein
MQGICGIQRRQAIKTTGPLAVLLAALAFLVPISASAGSRPQSCVVPRVVGLKLAAARLRLSQAHCRTGAVKWRFSSRAYGVVLAQDARPGAKYASGGIVGLTASKGQAPAPAPPAPAPPAPTPPPAPPVPPTVELTPGSYKGATSEGNYVFFTVTPNRTVTGFRINDLPEKCDGPLQLVGGVDWTGSTFSVDNDGSFTATGSWAGSQKNGDAEFTSWSARLTGRFSGTSASGIVNVTEELNYQSRHWRCTTGDEQWTAALLG